MEFVRSASNPWGQQVLLGLAWDVLWLVAVLGAVFVVVHAIFARKSAAATTTTSAASASGIPARVVRHGLSARVSHWTLAAATFTLLITAFVPILGLQFPWVTIHWIAGLVFGAYVIYHTFDTLARRSWGKMLPVSGREISHAIDATKNFFRGTGGEERQGKWNFENKAFHHITALAGLGVLATGLMMFARIDTFFWEANPYVFGVSDTFWGLVYVLHGLSAVGFVGLLIAHIYFALRPEKLWFTRSMIKGWITREEYVEHFDPARWPPVAEPGVPAPPPAVASAGSAVGPQHRK
jgi:cytochrome b subunit of formate dehydrogenase